MKKIIFLVAMLCFIGLLSGCGTDMQTSSSAINSNNSTTQTPAATSMLGGSDLAFLQLMIPHHQEAIDDSKIILAKSQNADLKQLAQQIVDGQTAEVKQMLGWTQQWFGIVATQGNSMKMMGDLSALQGDALDQAYIRGMITHHQTAIAMATELKTFTKRAELQTLAENILNQQNAEIVVLKGMETPAK